MKTKRSKVNVPAPDGYSWVEDRGRYYLSKGSKGDKSKPFRTK